MNNNNNNSNNEVPEEAATLISREKLFISFLSDFPCQEMLLRTTTTTTATTTQKRKFKKVTRQCELFNGTFTLSSVLNDGSLVSLFKWQIDVTKLVDC